MIEVLTGDVSKYISAILTDLSNWIESSIINKGFRAYNYHSKTRVKQPLKNRKKTKILMINGILMKV